MRIRISQTLIVNTLCSVIGPLLAYNAVIVWTHRLVFLDLYSEIMRCIEMASH